jgi:hypothetical protein
LSKKRAKAKKRRKERKELRAVLTHAAIADGLKTKSIKKGLEVEVE